MKKQLREFTIARVGLGRAGNSLPTRALLEFQLAHARARDAVHYPLDSGALAQEIEGAVRVKSAARDRVEYLRRPDLGRRLDSESRARLREVRADVVFVVADGLSALAVHRHAAELLGRVRQTDAVVIAEQARVAIGDEIGETLGASLSVVLIGERPGLSSPDSLGVYLTWSPRVGRTDAERNCISNIHGAGLAVGAAAELLAILMREARVRGVSGVELSAEMGKGNRIS